MSNLHKETFRGYLIDHHSPAPPTIDFTNLDIKEYEKFYKEANISNLMVYTKDHWGYSYYDTDIGTKHPGLKIDYIDEVSKVLRKNNIEFNAYYCLEYDTLIPEQHPEWSTRDQHGNKVFLDRERAMAKWGIPCYETGYRQYALGQLEEVVSRYHPDSLFLDIFGKTLCYCDCCKKKFKESFGYDLPETERVDTGTHILFDFGDKGRDVNLFLENCASEMLAAINKTVKTIDENIKVTINFAALYPKKIRDMLDYQFTEPWAGNWLSAAYSRDTAKNQYPQLGPGDVSEVYNYRPDSVYELAAAQIVANGCRSFFYSGSQHVDGTLEHTEALKVGKAYEGVLKYEDYLKDREVFADIAILQSDKSSMSKSGSEVVQNAIGRCKRSDAHREAILGAMILCDYAKYTWCIVPEQEMTIENSRNFKCIILASTFCITDELSKVLKEFAANGGSILADSECGLYDVFGNIQGDFAISDILGCNFKEKIDKYEKAAYGGYAKLDDNKIFKNLPDTYPPLGRVQYGVCNSTGAKIGNIVNPCTELTKKTWVNWWCPPPSKDATEYPVIVKNNNAVYVACDFFASTNSNLNLNKNLFVGILEEIIKAPCVRLDTKYPETISFVSYKKKNSLIVHVLSNLAEKTNGDAPEIEAGSLLIKKANADNFKVFEVYPVERELTFTEKNGYYSVVLPAITIHTVLEIRG